MAGGRVDEVPDNVFAVSSRINSTWGGGLTDMVRARRILEVVEADGLIPRAGALGRRLLAMLRNLADQHPGVTDPRGRGLMCAVTLESRQLRDRVVERLRTDERVLVLGCGTRSLRFRPALTVDRAGAGGGRRGPGPGAHRPGTVTRAVTWELRAAFARRLAAMYGREVPAYETLVEVTREINAEVVGRDGGGAAAAGQRRSG